MDDTPLLAPLINMQFPLSKEELLLKEGKSSNAQMPTPHGVTLSSLYIQQGETGTFSDTYFMKREASL